MVSVNYVNIHLSKLSSLWMLKLLGYNPIPSIPSPFGSGIAFTTAYPFNPFCSLPCIALILFRIALVTIQSSQYSNTLVVYKVFCICNKFKLSFAIIINKIIYQLYIKLSELYTIR